MPSLESSIHRELLVSLIEHGRVAQPAEIAARLDTDVAAVHAALDRLEAQHGVVLDPASRRPWLVHPFSTTPTLFYVRGAEHGWWAPCIWCALGVAVLVDEPVEIATTFGGETDTCRIRFARGDVTPGDLLAHFPVPVARAWDNVHRHCACTLVFPDHEAVGTWCERHAIEAGEVLTLADVAELARLWYGDHLAPDWRKPTALEARAVFERAGLTSPHWALPTSDERF